MAQFPAADWTTRRICWPKSCASRVIDPATTTMVGDRLHDIHAAQANTLRSIGVLWGYGGQAELQAAGADQLAATPAEVVGLV